MFPGVDENGNYRIIEGITSWKDCLVLDLGFIIRLMSVVYLYGSKVSFHFHYLSCFFFFLSFLIPLFLSFCFLFLSSFVFLSFLPLFFFPSFFLPLFIHSFLSSFFLVSFFYITFLSKTCFHFPSFLLVIFVFFFALFISVGLLCCIIHSPSSILYFVLEHHIEITFLFYIRLVSIKI